MAERRSIRTEYRRTLFRSKLEADWARALDEHGVTWEYEPRGQYFGATFYLVDFYLPCSRQWVEVKAVFEPHDIRRIAALLTHIPARPHTGDWCPDIPLIVATPGGRFLGWERGACRPTDDLLTLSRAASRNVVLFGCTECGGRWFADDSQSFQCQCCGAYDGDRYVGLHHYSPLPWPPTPPSHDVAAD